MIYLASKSPRRQQLLRQSGFNFLPLYFSITEQAKANETAEDYVERLAKEKAQTGWQLPSRRLAHKVLAADTVVVLDNVIMEKPRDSAEAKHMMSCLSGRSHEVLTGIACCFDKHVETEVVRSKVSFDVLSESEINDYLATGEYQDKAGGYGIQGYAARFVNHVDGSYTNIVGLPIYEMNQLLRKFP